MVLCKFFAQGECRFGDSCRFEHQFPSEDASGAKQFNNIQNQIKGGTSKPDVDLEALLTSVRNDMNTIERSGQWILSCYAPFKEKSVFPGFQDQSFEEVRLGFYEARQLNTFDQYNQQLQRALMEARSKFGALKTPTKEIVEILKNIYETSAVQTSNATSGSSIFGNTQMVGPAAQSTFGLNSTINPVSGGSLFGPSPSSQLFGQQNRTQNSGNTFGQQNLIPQNSNNVLFGRQTENNQNLTNGSQNANILFANANQSLLGAQHPTQNNQNLFGTSPLNSSQQTNIFQQNQMVYSGNNQSHSNQQFSMNNFSTVNKQGTTPQNPIFNKNLETISSLSNQQTDINNTPQAESTKSIFGNTSQKANSNLISGSIFSSGSNIINHIAYSRIDDLSKADIQWFSSNDLDIGNMPEKPPAYEMCFS